MVAKRSPELYSRHSQVDVYSNEKASRHLWHALHAWNVAGGKAAELKEDLMVGSFPWHRPLIGRKYGKQLIEDGGDVVAVGHP